MKGRLPDYEENSQIAADATNTLKILQDRAYTQLYGELKKSVECISYLRDNADEESIRLKASQDILDRAGLVPTKKVDVSGSGFHFQITPDQLSNIEQAKKLMEDA